LPSAVKAPAFKSAKKPSSSNNENSISPSTDQTTVIGNWHTCENVNCGSRFTTMWLWTGINNESADLENIQIFCDIIHDKAYKSGCQ